MKLLRYGNIGQEKPGLLDDNNQIRDLSTIISDFNPRGCEQFSAKLEQIKINELNIVSSNVRLGAPLKDPGKIICIGYNNKVHAKEMHMTPLPKDEMVFFLKACSAICGPNDPIFYTRNTKKLDWEAELGVIIGKKGKYIAEEEADEYILGYTCINDISDRYWQLETEDKQYTKGKSFDNSAPIGPYIITKEEIANPNNLQIKLWVNDELRQDFNTKNYIHNPIQVINYVSQFFTLYPGDIISMGSAPGTARSLGESFYLEPNDIVRMQIEGLGEQEKKVITEVL